MGNDYEEYPTDGKHAARMAKPAWGSTKPLDKKLVENRKEYFRGVTALCKACAALNLDLTQDNLLIRSDHPNTRYCCATDQSGYFTPHMGRIDALIGEGLKKSIKFDVPVTATGQIENLDAIKPRSLPEKSRPPAPREINRISEILKLQSPCGVQQLVQRGSLFVGSGWDGDINVWGVADSSRYAHQTVRLDGEKWDTSCRDGYPPESWELAEHSLLIGNWPIGAPEIGDRPIVLIVVGVRNLCAAMTVALWETGVPSGEDLLSLAPICMPEVGRLISPAALKYFAGKIVMIAPQNSAAGQVALREWSRQLRDAGAASVLEVNFLGQRGFYNRDVYEFRDVAPVLNWRGTPRRPLIGPFIKPIEAAQRTRKAAATTTLSASPSP